MTTQICHSVKQKMVSNKGLYFDRHARPPIVLQCLASMRDGCDVARCRLVSFQAQLASAGSRAASTFPKLALPRLKSLAPLLSSTKSSAVSPELASVVIRRRRYVRTLAARVSSTAVSVYVRACLFLVFRLRLRMYHESLLARLWNFFGKFGSKTTRLLRPKMASILIQFLASKHCPCVCFPS